nr:iron chelate uptake ABC transporter family permease subunit [Corynebacterium lemuris]
MKTTSAAEAPPRRKRHLLITLPGIVLRLESRTVAVTAVLTGLILALGCGALLLGDYPLTVGEALRALVGRSSDPLAEFFVQNQRVPRVLAAVLVGAALGASGAIFQGLSGNPLGSPDVIGFTVGAASGALIQIIVFNGGPVAIAFGALLGGFGTAALVYLLAWRGGLSGIRLVLVGIGVSSVLQGLNSLFIVRASLTAAQTAGQWQAGSFNATGWPTVWTIIATLVVLLPAALVLARPLDIMISGDDLATGLGVRVERRRLELLVVGVALVSMSVAVAGPIAFVALAAPQLARRLTRTGSVGIGVAAVMGGLLVLASDVVAQRLFAPTQLPVGVVTGTLGGIYLIWLLAREWRTRR